jgi:hypothetical protein
MNEEDDEKLLRELKRANQFVWLLTYLLDDTELHERQGIDKLTIFTALIRAAWTIGYFAITKEDSVSFQQLERIDKYAREGILKTLESTKQEQAE